jgi:hypothetical protein
MMKLSLLVALAAFSCGCLTAPSQAATCPADPAKASFAIWKEGELKMNVEATGTHPCGRQMACSGGSVKRSVARICRWL